MDGGIARATLFCVRVVARDRALSSPPPGQVHEVASCRRRLGWLFRVDDVSQPTYKEEGQMEMDALFGWHHLVGINYLQ
jgi:hypothetical protein